MRQPAVVDLRRGGQRDGADAGDLGGHDVHHHAGDQRRDAAGHVEPDPVDRHHPLGDRAAGDDLGDDVVPRARPRRWPQPADGLLEARADGGVQRGRAPRAAPRRERRCRSARTPSKLRGELRDRLDPALAHRVADRPDHVQRGLHVEVRARHHVAVVGGRVAPQVDPANHDVQSRGGWVDGPGVSAAGTPPGCGGLGRLGRDRATADVPAEHRAVPRRHRCRCTSSRTGTARWCTTCSAFPTSRCGSSGSSRSGRGTRSAPTAGSRCTGWAASRR